MISSQLAVYRQQVNRESQLSFFKKGSKILQDEQLIEFINKNHYTQAIGIGDVNYFNNFIEFVPNGPIDFCIFIQNETYDFWNIVDRVNFIIQQELNPNGVVYLSLNKYLAVPKHYDVCLPTDYDYAIQEFITRHVNATVEHYYPCGLDGGNKFNWVHPLTRFYLRAKK